VLVRAGHTEAAVDISRLAGLNPSGVICEIMNEDGSMARLPDLIAFAQRHGLKIGTISDLISYRRRHDNLVRVREEQQIESEFGGAWTLRIYTDETQGAEHIVLVKGDLSDPGPVLVGCTRWTRSWTWWARAPRAARESSVTRCGSSRRRGAGCSCSCAT
jgi:3,4-dihydroxy 2-butanone 4-phosphate synthase/GTP cyclohydrolase II